MNIKERPTFTVTVYIAGDMQQARACIRRFCMDGLCVTVTATTFIYTAGAEEGIAVGLIDYPRFPKTHEEIWEKAISLGMNLMDALCQKSFLVLSPVKTHWFTREDA